jgi:hypothetical protein
MRNGSPRGFAWVIGLACLISISSCGTTIHTLKGTIDLSDLQTSLSGCDTSQSNDGYTDIAAGEQVIVKNASGTTIGTGMLGSGHPLSDDANCHYDFTVVGLPDSSYYVIGIGSRGTQTFSESQLNSDHWSITLTLGG